MTKNPKNLDNFFKEKLSGYELSEKKGNWEAMNGMLNKQARQIQNTRLIQFIAGSVLVSASLFLFFNSNEKQENTKNNNNISESVAMPPSQELKNEPVASLPAKIKNKQSNAGDKNYANGVERATINPDVNLIPQSNIPDTDFDKSVMHETEISNEQSFAKSHLLNFNFYAGTNIDASEMNPANIELTNMDKEVNSAYADFAPVISSASGGSTMLFTSRRPVTEKEIKKNSQSMDHIYISEFNTKENKWTDAIKMNETINVAGRNTSAISLSGDGKRLLLYRDDINGNGDIYESTRSGLEWTAPVKLNEPINSRYHETSAGFSPDGRTIYFVSNRKEGMGGRDIWYCTQNATGKWGKAINIGEQINTKQDEEGIFIHPDGKSLYFSSKGHNGLGGYDIYKSVWQQEGKWSAPVNLGAHLNTSGDDVYFVMDAKGETAYYTSSKPGGSGEKDIYKIAFTPVKTDNKLSDSKVISLNYMISDEFNGNLLEASIEIVNNENSEVVSKLTPNSLSGKYFISLPAEKNYGIYVKPKGYLFHSENFRVANANTSLEINKTIHLKKIEAGNKIVLNNIFYDSNKATLRNESVSELKRLIELMNENPLMKIEISNCTINTIAKECNEKLSQARAQSAVDYLISKGIDKNRLVAKGSNQSASSGTELKILAK